MGNNNEGLLKTAYLLAVITILYNILEGIVSVYFGLGDGAMTLLGFGLDSFAEVISGIGIWHMVQRMIAADSADEIARDKFERRALRITGWAFYLLAAGLVLTSAYNLFMKRNPSTTIVGIIVSIISIIVMYALIYYKTRVGTALNSAPILADTACSRTCMYLSIVLFAASIGYELTGFGGLDSIGSAAIAVFSVREGREAFEKAEKGACACCKA